jgi:glycosyltransferase involved in cell wall biosynthesis
MSSLTVIVPAYNEEASLRRFLPELLEFCRSRDYRLIVVDDGSHDGTAQLLERTSGEPGITVLRHKVNRGYGAAIKTAIRVATTDCVITIDADGQHYLEDVERLHRELDARDADMIIGNRDRNRQSLYRRAGKNLIRRIARVLMPLHVRDINSGMKIYNTKLAQKYLRFCPDSMAYSDTITLLFVGNRHLVLEEPVSLRPRLEGTSSITARTAFDTVMEIVNIVVLFNPMRIFLPLAVIFVVLGILWDIPIFLRGEGVSVGALLLIVSGLLFFLLGLITEVLSSIRKDQGDR